MKRFKKTIIKVIISISMFMFPSVSVYASSNVNIVIKDLGTDNHVASACVTILDIEANNSYEYYTNNDGVISVPLNEYNILYDKSLYVSAHNNDYYGSYTMSIDNNVLYVEEDESFMNNKTLITSTRSGVDWNTISSSYEGDMYVPIGRVATYGGLYAGATFSTSYSWSITGSSDILGSASYTNTFVSACPEYALCSTNSHQWFNVFGKYARYKVVEYCPATNETRTRYFLAGNCLDTDHTFSSRTTGTTVNTTERIYTFDKNKVYSELKQFSQSSNYSYSYTGSVKTIKNGITLTINTTFSVTMKLSGGSRITYGYKIPSAVNRAYTIGWNKIEVS